MFTLTSNEQVNLGIQDQLNVLQTVLKVFSFMKYKFATHKCDPTPLNEALSVQHQNLDL